MIPATAYTPVDAKLIPTRRIAANRRHGVRFPQARGWWPTACAPDEGRDEQVRFGEGYDHNFALDKGPTAEPGLTARLKDPQSGRVLEVLTAESGVQFYAGNSLDGTYVGKSGHLYRMGNGIALGTAEFFGRTEQTVLRFSTRRSGQALSSCYGFQTALPGALNNPFLIIGRDDLARAAVPSSKTAKSVRHRAPACNRRIAVLQGLRTHVPAAVRSASRYWTRFDPIPCRRARK
jgi:galactose mutarotase-like enzyme